MPNRYFLSIAFDSYLWLKTLLKLIWLDTFPELFRDISWYVFVTANMTILSYANYTQNLHLIELRCAFSVDSS